MPSYTLRVLQLCPIKYIMLRLAKILRFCQPLSIMDTGSSSTLAEVRPPILGGIARGIASAIIRPDFVLPSQWSAAFRHRLWSREATLLAQVLALAWEDLESADSAVQRDASYFFEIADAGQPLSLRFLCEALGLELSAVQRVARERIKRAQPRSDDFVASPGH